MKLLTIFATFLLLISFMLAPCASDQLQMKKPLEKGNEYPFFCYDLSSREASMWAVVDEACMCVVWCITFWHSYFTRKISEHKFLNSYSRLWIFLMLMTFQRFSWVNDTFIFKVLYQDNYLFQFRVPSCWFFFWMKKGVDGRVGGAEMMITRA